MVWTKEQKLSSGSMLYVASCVSVTELNKISQSVLCMLVS